MTSILLAALAGLSDLASGAVPLYFRLNGSGTRYVIALAAGIMLGAVFFEMLPEISPGDSIYVGLGFFVFYLLERLTMIHSCGEQECKSEAHAIGWFPVLGMASDNLIDGIGIAIAYLLNPVTGIVVALSVIVHEIPQGLTTTLLLERSGKARPTIVLALLAQALLYPVGAALAFLVPEPLSTAVLAFVIGDFLYIAASDLLPDAHKTFNLKVVFAVILGAALTPAFEFLVKG